MHISMYIDMEYYDNMGEVLINKNKRTQTMSLKKFIKDTSQIENEVEKYIKRATKSNFNSSNAEAHPHLYSSMIYHYPKEKEHIMFLIRVEHMGKKVEFKDYYFDTEKNKEQL